MVLEALGIGLGRFRIKADRDEEAHDELVPRLRPCGEFCPGLGEEQAAIGPCLDKPVALQPGDRVRDGRLGNAHAPGEIDRPRLALGTEQIRDQLDIVLGDGGSVRFALAHEAGGLVILGRQRFQDGIATPAVLRISQLEALDSPTITPQLLPIFGGTP